MAPGRFEGKAAIVTGAASGIGAATVQRLLAEGAQVLAVDRDGDRLEAQFRAAGGGDRLRTSVADVAIEEQVQRYVAEAQSYFGQLNILVANAGMQIGTTPLPDTDSDRVRALIDVNIFGTYIALKHAIPVILESGGGSIVTTGSVSGLVGTPLQVAYSASKAAVINMSRATAAEFGARGIRVNSVCPGPIQTPFLRSVLGTMDVSDEAAMLRQIIPTGRAGYAEEVAAVIAFLVSDDASYVNGAAYTVDGGFTAI